MGNDYACFQRFPSLQRVISANNSNLLDDYNPSL